MFDAYAQHAERLCVENILSTCAQGGQFISHAEVTELIVENQQLKGLVFHDRLENKKYKIKTKILLNVAGPWVDQLLSGLKPSKKLIGGTKGSFLVVDSFRGCPKDSFFFETFEDGRPIVVTPWNGRYLIGTTDIRYDEDPGQAVITPDETKYLLREANLLFPMAQLTEDSILFTYAGVRPLPRQEEGATVDITRKHIVFDHSPTVEGLISIVGGKLSTYRNLAEEAVDCAVRKLGSKTSPCTTARRKFLGASSENFNDFCEAFKKKSPFTEKSTKRILSIYGTRSQLLIELAKKGDQDLHEVFDEQTGAVGVEVLMAFEEEHAQTLSDLLLRRSMVAYDSVFDMKTAEKAVGLLQKYLGWSAERGEEEIKMYRNDVQVFQKRNMRTATMEQEMTA